MREEFHLCSRHAYLLLTTQSGTLTSFDVLNADDLPGTKDIVSPVGQMLPGTYPRYPRRRWRMCKQWCLQFLAERRQWLLTVFPWPMLGGNSWHGTQHSETHDHQWWLDVSVVRRASIDVEADQRRRRPCTSAVDWSVSARYCGAVPWRQRCVRTIVSDVVEKTSTRRRSRIPCVVLEKLRRVYVKT